MREPKSHTEQAVTEPTEIGEQEGHVVKFSALGMLKEHNIRICALISICLVSWFLVILTFIYVFLPTYRGFSPEDTVAVTSVMGISTMLCGFLVPGLSDRIGRKPVMIVFTFIGMIMPLTALYFEGPLWIMALLFFVGWSATGSFALFMGVVPGESVNPKLAATSMGLVVCIGELVGGFAAPSLAGVLADSTSLQAPMYMCLGFAFLAGVSALFLKETAPSKVG